MNDAVDGAESKRVCVSLRLALMNFVQYAAAAASMVGVISALAFDGGWVISFVSAALAVLIEVALRVEALVLRWIVHQKRAEIARIRAETLQLQLLNSQRATEIAAKETYISQLRTEVAESERLKSQLETELEVRLSRQRNTELLIAANEARVSQLEIEVQQSELRTAQLEMRLEQSSLWEAVAALQAAKEDGIIEAYARGFVSGRKGEPFTLETGRHLRLVQSSA
ncbi:hypothetical protein [Streptomyces meridianus]|uniref:Uncharacterized protein n=1 Tax=Streptomyces meridianus TaxID=2938945 RepID=A0ABT0XAG7_9ACTN|nr:hypothetical protein [Streptomyces meridianus]MCM2579521.1 hypothetical protein [Streptomyces meridianus]